jgi:serine/threonine protein kinase
MSESLPLVPPGTLLDGKYLVERTLGEGGMGYVVAARHTVLGTRVAIKLLLPGAMADRDTVERFHREARSAVRIHSPHAARVHDVGTLANGTPYMVMDLLAGKDLDALREERGVLSPRETIDYVRQALEALHEAHGLGIIHRDLKPANLFLAEQPNGPPIVKVLDFGIARDFHQGEEQRLTRTRAVMGSPTYMSPEQMREARSADVRSDIWSMGVCLYELLTGKAPFHADTLPDLFVTVLHGTPVPPSALRPDLPPGLSDTILRCLEKDPARRFQSAKDLATALATGESGASWPAATTAPSATSSARVVVVASSSSPSLPSTERLATSRTIADTPSRPSPLKYLWVGAVALGLTGVALVAVARWRPSHAAITATTATSPTPTPTSPTQTTEPRAGLPLDLSNAGAPAPTMTAAPPATGASTVTPLPAVSSASPSPKTAPRGGRPVAAASAPPAVTTAAAAVAPPPVAPPPTAPAFDPKQAF